MRVKHKHTQREKIRVFDDYDDDDERQKMNRILLSGKGRVSFQGKFGCCESLCDIERVSD